MTLMEMIVVVAVVALVMSGLAMGIGTLTRQRLSSSSVAVAAMVRTAYSRAATTGKTVRIVLDLDAATLWVEEAEGGRVLLTSEDEEEDEEGEGEGGLTALGASEGGIGASAQADLLAKALGDDPSQILKSARGAAETSFGSTMDFDLLGSLGAAGQASPLELTTPRYKVPRFAAPEGRLGKRFRLLEGVGIARVETSHRETPAEEGKAYLYFFPGGVTEHAVIQLRDSRGYVNSVEVHPLTGRCRVHDVPFELPTREADLDEAREAS